MSAQWRRSRPWPGIRGVRGTVLVVTWLVASAAVQSGAGRSAGESAETQRARQNTVLFRINAGGPELGAADGSLPDWAEDTVANPSPYSNYLDTGNTIGTTPADIDRDALIPPEVPTGLFQSERWDAGGDAEMEWDFPIAAGEEVLVRLFFAETWDQITSPGQRVFNVAIEGAVVLDGFDVYAEAGFNTALMKWFIVTVGPDANLDIDFSHDVAQNPAVKGFEILSGDALLDTAIASAVQRAHGQLDITPDGYPINTDAGGTWVTTAPSNWTSGFFPGALWRCYARTGDVAWQSAAAFWTNGLEEQQYLTDHHDVGFMIFCSYGEGYGLTGLPDYRDVILTAAGSLAQRYNTTVGCVRASGDKDATTGDCRVIIDGMMNLELLLWASKHGGLPNWYDMAVSHAQRTADEFIRPDGSSYQEVFFDTATGVVLRQGTFNGYATDSTWSRGQAWGIHGFATLYRETGAAQFLTAACEMADYFIDHLPADHVPPWDFDAPGPDQERDSSAAAIAAAGLFELSTQVTDPLEHQHYWDAGCSMLKSLCTDAYLSNGVESEGTLLHGTYNKNFGQGVDASLIWGDYYLLQAVARYEQFSNPRGDCLTSLPTWQNRSFAACDGLIHVQFEAVPGSDDIDGLTALSQGAGSTWSDYAAIVRFNTSGTIDVRNGGAYEAEAAIAYETDAAYRFQMMVNVPNHTYTVYVAPTGGAVQVLASDYAFRDEQCGVTQLDSWALQASVGAHEVCDVRMTAVVGADCDGDSDVDLEDFATFQACAGRAPVGECACTDLDSDGDVDSTDQTLFIFQLAGP